MNNHDFPDFMVNEQVDIVQLLSQCYLVGTNIANIGIMVDIARTSHIRFRWLRRTIAGAMVVCAIAGISWYVSRRKAGIGIYRVISYMTRRRMQEFGIRMALGAKAGDVVRLALKQSVWMIVAGVIIGAASSMLASQALTAAIGVPTGDPLTFVSMVVLLVMIALIASFIPARRAGSADPASVLRQE
jgi:predicted lysophospholipase L1 biosynthesis ABC-type transport system permease subunit